MNDYLRVCMGMKPMAARFQTRAQFLEIIDLAVEDEPDGAVFVGHRLTPRSRDVNNGESIVGDSHALRDHGRSKAAELETIGAAMTNRLGHPLDRALEFGPIEALGRNSGESAHMLSLFGTTAG